MNKQGEVFMLVGATGSGKTYFTRQMIKGVNPKACLIFDVNNEWSDIYPYPFDGDMDSFLSKAQKVNNSIIIIEDATSFFAVQGRSDKLVKILIARRHTGNTTILLFHSFGDVPTYLYRKCTSIVCFKTHDSEHHVEKFDNDQIFKAWKDVQSECKDHPFFSTRPPKPGIVPPSKIVSIY